MKRIIIILFILLDFILLIGCNFRSILNYNLSSKQFENYISKQDSYTYTIDLDYTVKAEGSRNTYHYYFDSEVTNYLLDNAYEISMVLSGDTYHFLVEVEDEKLNTFVIEGAWLRPDDTGIMDIVELEEEFESYDAFVYRDSWINDFEQTESNHFSVSVSIEDLLENDYFDELINDISVSAISIEELDTSFAVIEVMFQEDNHVMNIDISIDSLKFKVQNISFKTSLSESLVIKKGATDSFDYSKYYEFPVTDINELHKTYDWRDHFEATTVDCGTSYYRVHMEQGVYRFDYGPYSEECVYAELLTESMTLVHTSNHLDYDVPTEGIYYVKIISISPNENFRLGLIRP